jgi:hypothetical protein
VLRVIRYYILWTDGSCEEPDECIVLNVCGSSQEPDECIAFLWAANSNEDPVECNMFF